MPLRIEEDLDMADMVGMRALEIGPGQVIKILLLEQHAHTLIIDVKKVLQITEIIGLSDLLDAAERDGDAIALRQIEQHFGLERTFDMQVEFGLGQAGDIGVTLIGCHAMRLCQVV